MLAALVLAAISKAWIEVLDRSECGRFSSLVDPRLSNTLVLISYGSAAALLFVALRGSNWDDVPRATVKRGGIGLLAVVVAGIGVASWAQMNYRCHGS